MCIVGHTANDEFLLIREFRFPMNRMCVAFPAGLREPGEDIVECAARELREETGFDLVRDECGQPVSRACMRAAWFFVAWHGRREHRHGICRGGTRG